MYVRTLASYLTFIVKPQKPTVLFASVTGTVIVSPAAAATSPTAIVVLSVVAPPGIVTLPATVVFSMSLNSKSHIVLTITSIALSPVAPAATLNVIFKTVPFE